MMTTHPTDPPTTDRVVAYRAPVTDHLFCAQCGESDTSTALTSDDLPDGGLCVGCGVDVLIPQTTDRPPQEYTPSDDREVELAHAEGKHEWCGPECEVELPTEQLRNFIVSKGYPGTAGMLDELLRRAAADVRDEEMQRLRADLAEARATIARVRHALMNQSHSTSLQNTITEALDGTE